MSYYVGIDIAKYKHDCFIMDDEAVVIRNSFSFPNNEDGFNQLLVVLDSLDHSQEIKIGLETTGHYGKNICLFLSEHNYQYMELNPYLVHKYAESITNRRTKTDKMDAKLIAQFISSNRMRYKPSELDTYNDLKILTRNRDKLVRERSDKLVVITNVLDRIFPEFKPFFNGHLGDAALTLLEENPSVSKIAKISSSKIAKYHNISRTISVEKFIRLKDKAKTTIGHASNADELLLVQTIKLYRVIDSSIDEIESQIKKLMNNIKTPLTSIPGIGIISAASIVAEYGDIATKFTNDGQLLAFAGLECSKHQSGTQDFKGKMVKRGNSHLRYVLLNVAVSLKNHCQMFATYYLKKRDEGKCYRVALNHVVRKFLRVAFKLVSTGEQFNDRVFTD